MSNLINSLLPIALFLSLIVLSYLYLSLRHQNRTIIGLHIQSELDKDLLKKQIMQALEDKKLVESEEFMMFLSKSREDAFAYIEEAQSAVKKFDDDIKKILSEDGNTVDTLMKILDANKQLQKLLPDNIKNNNVQGEL